MELGIAGRSVFVTGGANGIGQAIARMLAQEGAVVAIGDIDAAAGERCVEQLGGEGLSISSHSVDVSDPLSVAAAAARVGPVDILVNNAGFTRDGRFTAMEESAWDSVVDVILKGAYLCAKAFTPGMIERRWGRIINISSRAYLGNPGQANYSAAKAGLLGFTRAMALEHGKFGITVNAVAPGLIDTPAVRNLPHFEKVREAAERTLPLPRLGHVDDVAAAVAFLASERASYITGDVSHVCGGRYG